MHVCHMCHASMVLEADMSLDGAIIPPVACYAEGCRSAALEELPDFHYHTELQEVRLQERNSADSAAPASIDVLLLDELADRCKTGGASGATCCGMVTPWTRCR